MIGAEKLSDVVDPTDRSISFLLGDGAGAAVIGPSDTPGISRAVWGSDGSRADAVGMNHTLTEFRDGVSEWPTLRQEGPTVFRWAVWEMAKVAKEALDAAASAPGDLAAFIPPHQANMRIIDEFAKQLKLPETVVIARDIETTGNTSAASIPLATHRLLEEHPPELSGGLALQIGFGAGLVFAPRSWFFPEPHSPVHLDCVSVKRDTPPLARRENMALSTEEVLAGLAELINDETGIATDTVELDKSFTDDLDIDSISMMTIVVNAEEKFDVKIPPDEEVKNLKTVGDAVSFIVKAQD